MKLPADGSERRAEDRLTVLGELRPEIMVFQPISIREISRRGVQVETRVPLHLDSLHELRLTLGGQTVVVKGRVTHCGISHVDQEQVVYAAWLELVEPPSHADAAISAYLSDVRDERTPLKPSD